MKSFCHPRAPSSSQDGLLKRRGANVVAGAGTLTEGQLVAAMAELEAWDASARAAEDYDTEVARRELEAEHQRVRTALGASWARERADLNANRAERMDSLYGGFPLHSVFGGTP